MLVIPAVLLALGAALALGLRHGVDYDHIAAISDLTSVAKSKMESMRLAFLYALGHGSIVASLGVIAVLVGVHLPQGTDQLMERFVGATLLVLGIYVFYTLAFKPQESRLKTRLSLITNLFLRLHAWFASIVTGRAHEHEELFSDGYGTKSAFVVGLIHGISAETPTQLVLFVLASGLGGAILGISAVFAFIFGLLAMNTLMAAAFTCSFSFSQWRPALYRATMALAGIYSVTIGFVFLFGLINILPPLG